MFCRRLSIQTVSACLFALAVATTAASAQTVPAPPQRPAAPPAGPSPATPAAAAPAPPAATPTVAQPAPPVSTLPNGAASIAETYGSWTVDCRMSEGQKLCSLAQAQGNAQTGQRLFAIELAPSRNGRTEGAVLMPFGLRLESGALLKLDDRDLGQGLRFSTCTSQGCLLPISLPTVATEAMRMAQRLTVATLRLENGEVVTFNIAMAGFGQAFDRMAELAK
jgi:invasion protein IalB